MFIPTGYSLISLYHICTGDPEPMVVTFGVGTGLTTLDGATLAVIGDAWADLVVPHLSEEALFVGAVGRNGPVPSGDTVEYFQVPPVAGESGGQPATYNTAYLVRKGAAVGGRANRGRMFIPGVDINAVAPGGVIESTFLNNFQDSLTDFLAAVEAADEPMVILHTDEDLDPTPVTTLQLQSRVATQRRRLRP